MRKILAAIPFATLTISLAQAHAFLDHANPAVGRSVPMSPPAVTIWFTQELEPAFSSIEVQDQSGARVDAGDAQVDAKDGTILRVSLWRPASTRYSGASCR
jgi:methionine-rich copper-binding protein CopC